MDYDKRNLSQLGENVEELFRLAFEGAPNGMIVVDESGRIVLANSQIEKLFGYSEDELSGQPIEVLVPERFRHVHPGHRKAFMHEPQSRAMGAGRDLFGRRKDGSEFPVEIGLNPMKTKQGTLVLASVIDITERKRAEERFRLVVEGAPNGMIMVDQKGSIILANSQIERLFGYTKEELLGEPIEVLVPQRFRAKHPDHRKNFSADPKVRAMGAGRELFGVRKDGSEFPVEIGLNPMMTETGQVILASVIDITERKRADEERVQLYETERILRSEAEVANRLKDEFLGTLSHELRTPLNAIVGWAQILRRKRHDPAETERAADVILKSAKSQAQIISDLLDMNRIISGKMKLDLQKFDVGKLINSTVDSLLPEANRKGLSIIRPAEPCRIEIVADSSRLQQCIWNLLSNAIKFTNTGSIQIECRQIDNEVEIRISDTGMGMNPDLLPYIFDRFRQADSSSTRRHGGLGLGLSIAKTLIELHGGTVRADSRGLGEGSIFILRLPDRIDSQGDVEAELPSKAPTFEIETVDLSGTTILVIDDEPDAREMLSKVLEERGSTVISGASADEGLRLVKEKRPDIIISDIGMPGRDGFDFIRSLRASPPEEGSMTPAMALTAYVRPEDKAHALQSGYQLHLDKPLDHRNLLEGVLKLYHARLSSGKADL